jgi:hypothetical protein
MPLLAPTASEIGHGQLGLRSGLRTFDVLTRESDCQKHAFVELRGAKLIAFWDVHSGSVYKSSFAVDEVFRGRRLDVVQVRLSNETLTRVEAIADVVAGTFFFDPQAGAASLLYVRLGDSSDPGDQPVFAIFGFYVGTVGVVQPTLGPDKLTDGGLNVWSSPTALTNWTTTSSLATGASLNKDATIVAEGAFAARLEGFFDPGGRLRIDNDANAPATIAGAEYLVSGWYRTEHANAPGITARLGLKGTGASEFLAEDGRSVVATAQQMLLVNTNDEWQRFAFYAIAPSTTLAMRLYVRCDAAAGGGFGRVWFDGIKLQRVYRHEYHEPRLDIESLPTVDEGRLGIFFDRWAIGHGALRILNGEGWAEELFGAYEWTSRELFVSLGGRFAGGGNEILAGGMKVKRWLIRRVTVRDGEALLDLDDQRSIFNELLPNKTLDPDEFTNMAVVDEGRPRALIFSSDMQHIRPARVDKDGTTGYGIYELLDPTYAGFLFLTLQSYVDEQSAAKEDPAAKVDLTIDSVDFSAGSFEILEDVKPRVVVTGENNLLDFDEGGGALLAVVAAGRYPATGANITDLVEAVKTALDAAGGTYTVTYSNSTHKITVTQTAPATTFNIRLTSAAANRDRSLWPMLGFTGNTDRTGALAYTADDPIFLDVDSDHVVRCSTQGYVDGAGGDYTGTPLSPIVLPGDILNFILQRVFNVPAADIDLASVVAVRSGADELSMYLGVIGDEVHEFGQIVEWVENSNGIEMLHDGERFFFRKRDNSIPANILDLYDRDFLSFEGWVEDDDLACIVRVEGDQDPSTGQMRSGTVSETHSNPTLAALCGAAKLRLGRDKSKSFRTYLPGGVAYIDELIVNSTTPRYRFRFAAKGSAMNLIIGDKVRLNRTTMLGGPQVVARIIRKRDNWSTWVSEVEAAEVLVGVTDGW